MTDFDGMYSYHCEKCETEVAMVASVENREKKPGFQFACKCDSMGQHMGEESVPVYWVLDFDQQVGDGV